MDKIVDNFVDNLKIKNCEKNFAIFKLWYKIIVDRFSVKWGDDFGKNGFME